MRRQTVGMAVFWVIAVGAGVVWAEFNAVYWSPKSQHVVYSIGKSKPTTISLELRVEGPNNPGVWATGATNVFGTNRLDTTSAGDNRFILKETYTEGSSNVVVEHSVAVLTKATNVAGSLRFDETLELGDGVWFSGGMIYVPDGITLGIANTRDPVHGLAVRTDGNLALNECQFPALYLDNSGTGGERQATLTACRVPGPVQVDSVRQATFTTCYFPTSVYLKANNLVVTDCLFTEPGYYGGPVFAPIETYDIGQCEFHCAGAGFATATASGSIHDNAFVDATLGVPGNSNSPPVVVGNSFYFSGVATNANLAALDLDGNYWAGRFAYDGIAGGWLDDVGSGSPLGSSNTTYLLTGNDRPCSLPDLRPLPLAFASIRYGDIVLGGRQQIPARSNRACLVVCEILFPGEGLAGAAYELRCGSQTFPPDNPGFVARMDYRNNQQPHQRTLNFILPATFAPGTNNLELWMDASGAPGWTNNPIWQSKTFRLEEFTIAQAPEPARPLRIGVVAASIQVSGYVQDTDRGNRPRNRPSSLDRVIRQLREDIPTHWPLNDDELEVVNLGVYDYEGGWLTSWLPQVSSVGMMYSLALELNSFLDEYNANQSGSPLDALVCVVPGTSLGAANEGASLRGLRRIALVDEGSPGAALHELGHAFGLYAGTEQYDLPVGEDADGNLIVAQRGAILQNTTIFNSAPAHSPAALAGGRIRHFPYGSKDEVYDFMGAKEPHWIVPSSLIYMRNQLVDKLGYKTSAKKLSSAPADMSGAWPLQFNALYRIFWNTARGEWDTEVAPESLQISSGVAADWQPTANSGAWLNVLVNGLDAAGVAVTSFFARAEMFGQTENEWYAWHEIRAMPAAAVLCKVWHTDNSGHPLDLLGVYARSDVPTNQLTANLTGTGTNQLVVLAWTLGASVNPEVRLDRNLYFSTNGVDWTDLRATFLTNRVEVPPELLGSPAQAWFRLVVSDGFGETVSQAGPLAMPAQPPVVAIRYPQAGDIAPTGAVWLLAAVVSDLRDNPVTNVTWRSSTQGVLGTGPQLTGISLNPGAHLLSCVAVNGAGLSATGQVTVTVSLDPATNVDMRVSTNAFTCLPAGGDPAGDMAVFRLVPGKTNILTVSFRNQGVVHTAGVSIAVSAGGGAFQELLATNLLWQAFEERVWGVPFMPTSRQPHTVRAQFQSLELPDPDPANNLRTWTLSNLPPAARSARIEIRQTDLPLTNRIWAYDANDDAIQYGLVSPPATGAVVLAGSNFTYSVSTGWQGTASFQFRASDGMATSAPATVTLVVRPRRVAPVLTSALSANGAQGQPFSYRITATNNPVQFTATSLPAGLALDAATGWITGTPTVSGNRSINIGALNLAGSTTAVLSASLAPGWPIITSAFSAAQYIGQPFAYQIQATNNPTGFAAGGLPAGLGLQSASGWITGTCSVAGTYTTFISASNAYGATSGWLDIHIVNPSSANDYFDLRTTLAGTNVALSGTTATATRENGEPAHAGGVSPAGSLWWTWTAPKSGFVTVAAESYDFDTLLAVYTGSALNGLTCVVSNNNWRWLSSSLLYFQAVSGTVYQIALDGDYQRGAFDLHLEYRGAPLITSPVNFYGIAGQPFQGRIDAVNNPTGYNATNRPGGLGVIPATGVITGTPAAKTAQYVYLLASNAFGSDTSKVWFTIYSAQYPVFTNPPHVSGVAQSNFAFQLQATHAQAGTYGAWPLPFGLAVDANNGWITGTPGQAGVFNVPVSVRNSQEELATNTLVLNIRLPYNEWLFYHFTAQEIADPEISGPGADPDDDGVPNDGERWCGTFPKDPDSVLAWTEFSVPASTGVLNWQSVSGHFYQIAVASNATGPYLVFSNQIPATAPVNALTDTVPRGVQANYQIRLEP